MAKEKPKKIKIKSKRKKWKFEIKIIHLASLALFSFMSFLLVLHHYDISIKDIASLSFYENLANPSMRIVRIREGLRKEEVADILSQKFGWNKEEENEFLNSHIALGRNIEEGYLFPKSYMIHKDTDPVSVAQIMSDTLSKETQKVKKSKNTEVINEETILKIASIIQRESGGKKDMRLISGIVWNRIFKGMKLQIDATLQYAKGNEELWWPPVKPEDKYIDSPYNTYMYNDLPPSPIANPGIDAIEAAYNPAKTSCIFYLHDKKGRIHCSPTYEGHKKNIDKYY